MLPTGYDRVMTILNFYLPSVIFSGFSTLDDTIVSVLVLLTLIPMIGHAHVVCMFGRDRSGSAVLFKNPNAQLLCPFTASHLL